MINLDYVVGNNSLGQWLLGLAIFAIVWTALTFLKRYLQKTVASMTWFQSELINELVIEFINKTSSILIFLISLLAGVHSLTLPSKLEKFINVLTVAVLFIQMVLWTNTFINLYVNSYMKRHDQGREGMATAINIVNFVAKTILFSVLLVLALDQVGVNITTLIAGLGIGGIAVALALQNVLGDLFSSLSIIFDRPFVVGDFLTIDDYAGTVDNVGLKSTRITSLSGEQIIFSNSDLLRSRIRNYKRMYTRRVEFAFSLSYETAVEDIERITSKVKEIISGIDKVTFDRAHFKKFGTNSLDFEVVYSLNDPNYNLYMDVQQKINIELLKFVRGTQLAFALPTQRMVLANGRPLTDSREQAKTFLQEGVHDRQEHHGRQ